MAWREKLKSKIRQYLDGYTACHDFWHMDRVRQNALKIAEKVSCDKDILEAAALLHDIGYRFHEEDDRNHQLYGMKIASEWLVQLDFPKHKIADVLEAIRLHDDYHRGKNAEKTDNVEAKIIQDADKIDTMGAIGVARLIYYLGEKGHPIYNHKPSPETDAIWLNHSLPDQLKRDSMLKWSILNYDYSRQISKESNHFLNIFYERLVEELLGYHGEKDESQESRQGSL